MKEETSFGWLFADSGNSFAVFDMDSKGGYNADYYDYVLNLHIDLYGLPADLSEQEQDAAYEGHCDRRVKLGALSGTLVLGAQAEQDGFDLYDVCDANSGDLEHAYFCLSQTDVFDTLESNFFYLYDLVMESGQDRNKQEVLNRIPNLLFHLVHIKPSYTVFYPRPLPYEEPVNKTKELVESLAWEEARQKMDTLFGSPTGEPDETASPYVVECIPLSHIGWN